MRHKPAQPNHPPQALDDESLHQVTGGFGLGGGSGPYGAPDKPEEGGGASTGGTEDASSVNSAFMQDGMEKAQDIADAVKDLQDTAQRNGNQP